MSEADYQRGLRGGDCPVSISEYGRWKDWKAGHDEYERRMEEEDDARYIKTLSPSEKVAWLNERIAHIDAKQASREAYEREYEVQRQQRKRRDAVATSVGVPAVCLSVGLVAGIVVGYPLKWFYAVPVPVTVIIILVIAALWAWGAVNAILKDAP